MEKHTEETDGLFVLGVGMAETAGEAFEREYRAAVAVRLMEQRDEADRLDRGIARHLVAQSRNAGRAS